jgi:hypothetical protein
MIFSDGMRFRHCLVRHVSCSLTRLRISLNMLSHLPVYCNVFLLAYVVFLLICHIVRVKGIVHLLSIDMSKKICFERSITCQRGRARLC